MLPFSKQTEEVGCNNIMHSFKIKRFGISILKYNEMVEPNYVVIL